MKIALRHIRAGKMYDPDNPCIAILDEKFEALFNVKYCPFEELHKHLKHYFYPEDYTFEFNKKPKNSLIDLTNPDATVTVLKNHVVRDFKVYDKYIPSKELKDVMFSFESFVDRTQESYTLRQILSMIQQYISINRDKLFDPRNMNVVIIKGDLLEKAFKCMCFTKIQMARLVLSQLEPV